MSKHCDACDCDVRKQDFNRHLRTKKHLANVGGLTNTTFGNVPVVAKAVVVSDDDTDEESGDEEEGEPEEYLAEFSNTTFNRPEPPTPVKPPIALSSREKLQKLFQNKQRVESTLPSYLKRRDNDSVKSDEIFSSKSTKIVGKEYREKLAKVKQYKAIFKSELKSFKIKKNASSKDLDLYLEEMQNILDTQTTNSFNEQAIYYVLQMVESVSSRFKNYDMTGLSEMLRGNEEFKNLCKILSLKYGSTFGQTPAEAQMALILIGTAYICISRNKMEAQMTESYVLPTPKQKV